MPSNKLIRAKSLRGVFAAAKSDMRIAANGSVWFLISPPRNGSLRLIGSSSVIKEFPASGLEEVIPSTELTFNMKPVWAKAVAEVIDPLLTGGSSTQLLRPAFQDGVLLVLIGATTVKGKRFDPAMGAAVLHGLPPVMGMMWLTQTLRVENSGLRMIAAHTHRRLVLANHAGLIQHATGAAVSALVHIFGPPYRGQASVEGLPLPPLIIDAIRAEKSSLRLNNSASVTIARIGADKWSIAFPFFMVEFLVESQTSRDRIDISRLSKTERDLVVFLRRGMTTKEIAEARSVAEATIQN